MALFLYAQPITCANMLTPAGSNEVGLHDEWVLQLLSLAQLYYASWGRFVFSLAAGMSGMYYYYRVYWRHGVKLTHVLLS